MHSLHREAHLIERIGWLRAAVLGANDGIISTASLVVGVAAASTSPNEVIVAGVAGLVAGATAMAAGEYVSVSSQADTEAADLAKEKRELAEQPDAELHELTNIYVGRGLDLVGSASCGSTNGERCICYTRTGRTGPIGARCSAPHS